VGGAGAFDNAHIHPLDMADFATGGGIGLSVAGRVRYIRMIAAREKGTYPYDLAVDVTEWGPQPPLTPLADGQVIELGNRRVEVVACPGHTAGSVTFLDEKTRTLFVGDAFNGSLLLGLGRPGTPRFVSVARALTHLRRLQAMQDRYDRAYNGHYDFRPLGEPLDEGMLPDVIAACEGIVAGTVTVVVKPSPLREGWMQHVVTVGRASVAFNPDGIRDTA
jgi:glyoxylase-like metal-dependent hydrolase (beta-lactamase superfamily II)